MPLDRYAGPLFRVLLWLFVSIVRFVRFICGNDGTTKKKNSIKKKTNCTRKMVNDGCIWYVLFGFQNVSQPISGAILISSQKVSSLHIFNWIIINRICAIGCGFTSTFVFVVAAAVAVVSVTYFLFFFYFNIFLLPRIQYEWRSKSLMTK